MEQKQLPNAVAVLVLGILSLVTSCMFVGLILGIIGLALSGSAMKLYRSEPQAWAGYGMLNAGRIMSIIGIIFGALYVVWYIIAVMILGAAGMMGMLQNL